VLVLVVGKKGAAIGKQFHDDGIRGEDVLTFVFRQAFEIHALVVERSIGFESIFLAGIEVVGAVAGSGVNDAAALIESDVVRKDAGNLNGHKGVLKFHALEIAPLVGCADFGFFDIAFSLKRSDAIGSEE